MKFSLKHLIMFVTLAAMLCGVLSFAYTRVRVAHQMAMQARQMADESHQMAMVAQLEAEEAKRTTAKGQMAWKARMFHDEINQVDLSGKYSILHWNIESGGNDPATIARQLIGLGRYDIIGLFDVSEPEVYEKALKQNWPNRYAFVRDSTGKSDSLLMIYDKIRFGLVERANIKAAGGILLKNGRHRAPLHVRLKEIINGQELIVILNHLARGDAEFRVQQAGALREWARNKSTPMVAIGNYSFDFDFITQKGNAGFDEFIRDGVWQWIKPVEMIDTNWSDDGKGNDRYPDSMLDFNFVAGGAKDWKAESRVIVRERDFPDDDKTSNHRPVELILRGIKL